MAEHPKVATVRPRVQYATDGVLTLFTFPFLVFRADEVEVRLDAARLASGFSVEGTGQTSGGAVRFATAPAAGSILTLTRRLSYGRSTDFLAGGELRADALNDDLDRLACMAQDLDEGLGRALRIDPSEGDASLILPDRATRGGKLLAFDEAGNVTVAERSSGDGGGGGTFLAIGAGAKPRAVADKLADRISVRDFGAAGDGVVDDTVAFTAAIAAANEIFVPPGRYRVTQPVVLVDGKRLHGAGEASEIVQSNAGADLIRVTGSYNRVTDLKLTGGAAGVRLIGEGRPCVQNLLADLAIWDADRGLVLDGGTDPDDPCYWNAISRVLVARPKIDGVRLQLTGNGDTPNANRFHGVRVYSLSAPITGSGFDIDAGRHMNLFVDCEANLSTTARSCFRLGPGADKTQIINLYTETVGPVDNVVLDPGCGETTIVNLHAQSAGAAIWDLSDGPLLTFNAGFPVKNRLGPTEIAELTAEDATLKRVAWRVSFVEGQSTHQVELDARVNLVSAFGGPVTAVLPVPSAAVGRMVTIKKSDPSANAVTVRDSAGDSPDSVPTVLSGHNDFVTVISNGAQWWVMGMRF